MASNDTRQFHFYPLYDWTPGDFTLLQQWMYQEIQGLFEGLAGAAVMKGLKVYPGSGMNATVDSGIAVSDGGQMMVQASQVPKSVPAPLVNPVKHLLVMRPKLVDMTSIPEPVNPSNMVPLHFKMDFDLMLLTGVESATPVYPTTQAGDCIVMGFTGLVAGQTQLTRSNLDYGIVSRPRKRKMHVAIVAGTTYPVGEQDDVIELDCTTASGLAQLPPAASAEGMKVTCVKTDSSANQGAVSGNGAETISGQNAIWLDVQWDAATVYSNGISWRQIT